MNISATIDSLSFHAYCKTLYLSNWAFIDLHGAGNQGNAPNTSGDASKTSAPIVSLMALIYMRSFMSSSISE